MKRALIVLTVLLLLISPVLAAENKTTQPREKLSALAGGLDNQTEDILAREVPIPKTAQPFLEFIFGVKEHTTWQELIVTLGIWIGFCYLIFAIVGLFPFFKKGTIAFLASVIIMILISITGALGKMATFFLGVILDILYLIGLSSVMTKWPKLQTTLVIIASVIIVTFFAHAVNKLKNKIKVEEAEERGRRLAEGSESAEVFSKGLDEVSNSGDFKYSRGMKRGKGVQGDINTRYKRDKDGNLVYSNKGGKRKKIVERKGSNLFVKKKSAERYAKMFGDEQAKKRFSGE